MENARFQPRSISLRTHVVNCQGDRKDAPRSIVRENVRQSTPRQGYTDVVLSQWEEDAFDKAQDFHSISLVNDKQISGTLLAPEHLF